MDICASLYPARFAEVRAAFDAFPGDVAPDAASGAGPTVAGIVISLVCMEFRGAKPWLAARPFRRWNGLGHLSQQFSLSPPLLGWFIAMLLSVSTGSATVGIADATGLLAPLAVSGAVNATLLARAIGCGSLFFNHANHAGFWLVKESFGMSIGGAKETISVIQSIVSVIGLTMVLLMNLLSLLV